MGIVVGILILSLMMFVHELGHYLTGRRLGFTIEEFSIFMGPVLFSRTRNNIKYSIKLLPIGASVRFAGEYGDDAKQPDDPGSFFNRPKWARALVIGTGPALNLLSGVLALIVMFSVFGYGIPVLSDVAKGTQADGSGLSKGDRVVSIEGRTVRTILDYQSVIMFADASEKINLVVRKADGSLTPVTLTPEYRQRYRLGITITSDGGRTGVIDSVDAASNNGSPVLRTGDVLVSVDGVPFEEYDAFAAAVENSAGRPIQVAVIRGGETVTLDMAATMYQEVIDRGIYFQFSNKFLPAVGQSLAWPWSIIKLTLRSVGMMFAGTIRPQDTIAGPIGVVTIIGQAVTQEAPLSEKIQSLIWMFALISVSLGFMNLLPIPPLDGYHLVLIAVEAVRRKRLTARTQNIIGIIGICFIVILGVAGLIFDILRLAGG